LASFDWPDNSGWRIEFGDESVEPLLWRGDSLVMRRTRYAFGGLVPTADWQPCDGSPLPAFQVRDELRLGGRTVRYRDDDRELATFRWRWWWQEMFLECDETFESALPVLCADLLTHIHFKTPA
jgi:hypothetical protein